MAVLVQTYTEKSLVDENPQLLAELLGSFVFKKMRRLAVQLPVTAFLEIMLVFIGSGQQTLGDARYAPIAIINSDLSAIHIMWICGVTVLVSHEEGGDACWGGGMGCVRLYDEH